MNLPEDHALLQIYRAGTADIPTPTLDARLLHAATLRAAAMRDRRRMERRAAILTAGIAAIALAAALYRPSTPTTTPAPPRGLLEGTTHAALLDTELRGYYPSIPGLTERTP